MESHMQKLTDKTVIVTGGAGGIGGATCRRFAREGAKVAVFPPHATRRPITRAPLHKLSALIMGTSARPRSNSRASRRTTEMEPLA